MPGAVRRRGPVVAGLVLHHNSELPARATDRRRCTLQPGCRAEPVECLELFLVVGGVGATPRPSARSSLNTVSGYEARVRTVAPQCEGSRDAERTLGRA